MKYREFDYNIDYGSLEIHTAIIVDSNKYANVLPTFTFV